MPDRALIVLPDKSSKPIVDAIATAKGSLRVKMFVFSDPGLLAAVVAAHRRGVNVRVMLNAARRSGEDDRRELAIEVNDDALVEGLHGVARQDWENSRALDLTDEGLFANLADYEGGAEKLVLRADAAHAQAHPHKHAGKAHHRPAM